MHPAKSVGVFVVVTGRKNKREETIEIFDELHTSKYYQKLRIVNVTEAS